MTTFTFDTVAELNRDLPAFDPFDPCMSARDRRDVRETYGTPSMLADLVWCRLTDVAAKLH